MREQHKGGLIMENKLKIGDEVYLISHKPYFVKMKDAMLDPFKATFIVEDVNYGANPADPLVTISRNGKSHIVRSKQLMVKAKTEIKKVRGGANMKNKFKIGDLALVKSCSSNNENYSRLIGCRGRIVDISADGKEYKMLFESLPDKFNVGNFHLHDCGEEDICKYVYILKIDVVPVDNPEPTLMISKDKKILVEFIEETSSGHFKGTVLRDACQEFALFKVGNSGSFWIKDAFEPATRDNVPSEWKHIIPEPKKTISEKMKAQANKVQSIVEKCDIANEESSDNISKPRFQIVRMCKTKNQEREYAHALFTYMEEIVDGATYAFINSKCTGGVIYGKHANEMLERLKQANPDKTFEVVVTQKNIPSNIKQISLKISANKDVNYFVL